MKKSSSRRNSGRKKSSGTTVTRISKTPDHLILSFDIGTQGTQAKTRSLKTGKEETFDVDHDRARWALDDRIMLKAEYPGQAEQPVEMHLDTIQKLLGEIGTKLGPDMRKIVRIAVAGQQHGSFNVASDQAIITDMYTGADSIKRQTTQSTLGDILVPQLTYPNARTWRTSSSGADRERMIKEIGSRELYVRMAGSLPFERFTGTALADFAKRNPQAMKETKRIFLIEQLLGLVATGSYSYPMGYGGACGTAIFDWQNKSWHPDLVRRVFSDPDKQGSQLDGMPNLNFTLPKIVRPGTAYQVSEFFSRFSRVNSECKIYEPAGDNPAARNAVPEEFKGGTRLPTYLYSFGSSGTANFGMNVANVDPTGTLALMFDYIGQPFFLGCMTNCMTSWDSVRDANSMSIDEQTGLLAGQIKNIRQHNGKLGEFNFYLHLLNDETMPEMKKEERRNYASSREKDGIAVVFTTMANMVAHTESALPDKVPVYVTGGGSKNNEAMIIFASMLNREVRVLSEGGGPCDGGLNAAELFYRKELGQTNTTMKDVMGSINTNGIIRPDESLVKYLRSPNGYLAQFKRFLNKN